MGHSQVWLTKCTLLKFAGGRNHPAVQRIAKKTHICRHLKFNDPEVNLCPGNWLLFCLLPLPSAFIGLPLPPAKGRG